MRTCYYYPNYPNSYTKYTTRLALQIAFSLLLANIILLSCFSSEASCCTDYPTHILNACCKSSTTYSYSSNSDSAALVSFKNIIKNILTFKFCF